MTGSEITAYQGNDFYCDVAIPHSQELQIVFEDECVLAFHHTRPFWQTHIVVAPKAHIASLDSETHQACLFCLTSTDGPELAQRYIASVLSWTWKDEVDGGDHPVHECIECGDFALVDGTRVRNRAKIKYVCFSCAEVFNSSDVARCDRCGSLMHSGDETGTCSDCWSALVSG